MSTRELTAEDGHQFVAYESASPATMKRAEANGESASVGIVVLQEIFGVNEHIRAVCDRFAASGFDALAPAMFDRYSPDYESGYSPEEVEHSKSLMAGFDWDKALLDISASVAYLAQRNSKVALVGYCLGGSLAYLAATKGIANAAVSYYGGRIPEFMDAPVITPTICHFGEQDAMIPMDGVNALKQRYPELPVYLYDAGHGFNCDLRPGFDQQSADLALKRSMDFILENCAD